MPVSIVVGGQFGSEGKGKVALEIVRRSPSPVTVVRVGGPNSGHTGYDRNGRRWALRQLPAAAVDRSVDVVFPPGSYIDPEILAEEINALGFSRDRLFVSPFARVITSEHRQWERNAGLVDGIGSTGSGVGAAVLAAVARGAPSVTLPVPVAADIASLQHNLIDTSVELYRRLRRDERIVVEGTQGFGLSLLDGGYWPKATSRFTTAAGALAEAGIGPREVDDVTLVIRSFPIRVAGRSGPLPGELTWDDVSRFTGSHRDLREFTTVTGRLRRVGTFDGELVRRAIAANSPTRLVMNHLDYVGTLADLRIGKSQLNRFLSDVHSQLPMRIEWMGFSPEGIVEAKEAHV